MKEWHKVLLAMIAAALAAWKLRKHREELKGLHEELIEIKNENIDLVSDAELNRRLDDPASYRKRRIITAAAKFADELEGSAK